MNMGQFVCDTIGLKDTVCQSRPSSVIPGKSYDVTARRRSAICTNNDTVLELYSHDRSTKIDLSGLQPVHIDGIHGVEAVLGWIG